MLLCPPKNMPAETLGCCLFTCHSVVAPGSNHQWKAAAAYSTRLLMAAQVAAFMQRLLNIFHCNTPLRDNFEQFRLNIPDVSCLTNRIFFGKLLLKGFSYFQD